MKTDRETREMANGCKVIEGRQHRYWCAYDDPDQQRRCPFHAGPDWCVHNTSPRGDVGDWCWSTDAARDAEGRSDEHYPCKPDIFAATYEPAET